jgi:hypothetical protein
VASTTRSRNGRHWVLPTLLLGLSLIVAWRTTPPQPLIDWLGNLWWARAALAFVLFCVFVSVMVILGFLGTRVGLPLGFSFDPRPATEVEPEPNQLLLTELSSLRESTERAFIRFGEVNQLVNEALRNSRNWRIGLAR